MNDAQKLRTLADWFDMRDKSKGNRSDEIQRDLRRMAAKIDTFGGDCVEMRSVIKAHTNVQKEAIEERVQEMTKPAHFDANTNKEMLDIFNREDDFYNK